MHPGCPEREHDRRWLRYASDCVDEGWAIIAPPLARTAKAGRAVAVQVPEPVVTTAAPAAQPDNLRQRLGLS